MRQIAQPWPSPQRGGRRLVASGLRARGAERVTLITSPGRAETALDILGPISPTSTVMVDRPHAPTDWLEELLHVEQTPDWLVAIGGGAVIGVAKAMARRSRTSICAIPTTYSGSEQTNIWGETEGGQKRTGRDDACRPAWVIYDPELQRDLPTARARASLVNALAHSVEALWSTQATARATHAARQSVPLLTEALHGERRGASPRALEAACLGAAFAGIALDGAQMALHHKLAHVVGGACGTPHAETHAALLPHTLRFNGVVCPEVLRLLSESWGSVDPCDLLQRWLRDWGLPASLRELGVAESQIAELAELADRRRYANPRPVTKSDYAEVLTAAWRGSTA